MKKTLFALSLSALLLVSCGSNFSKTDFATVKAKYDENAQRECTYKSAKETAVVTKAKISIPKEMQAIMTEDSILALAGLSKDQFKKGYKETRDLDSTGLVTLKAQAAVPFVGEDSSATYYISGNNIKITTSNKQEQNSTKISSESELIVDEFNYPKSITSSRSLTVTVKTTAEYTISMEFGATATYSYTK